MRGHDDLLGWIKSITNHLYWTVTFNAERVSRLAAFSLYLLTLPFLSKHFTSVSGYRIFHGLSPKYFSDSFCDSVKKDFNLRDNLKLQPNNITML